MAYGATTFNTMTFSITTLSILAFVIRVTRRLKKCGPNCSQNIKKQIDNQNIYVQLLLSVEIITSNYVFEQLNVPFMVRAPRHLAL